MIIRLLVSVSVAVLFARPALAGGELVPYAAEPPEVDGDPTDLIWAQGGWKDIDHPIIGAMPEPKDFSGRYKLAWNHDYLFLLVELQDDTLIDTHPNPLEQYWNDDSLEVFLDEDASGGEHLYSHNAFAYHIALDNQTVDLAPDAQKSDSAEGRPALFPDHVISRWRRSDGEHHLLYWELSIAVYEEAAQGELARRLLAAGDVLGLMVAYNDSDDASGRQSMVGDIEIEPVDGDRNRGYIDADVFGRITLSRAR